MEVTIHKIGINWENVFHIFGSCFILLKEKDGERYLPIFIGQMEANSIIMGLEKIKPPRPFAHELLSDSYQSSYDTLKHVEVTEIKDSTFYAKLVFFKNKDEVEIDCRPSDGIAIAVRMGCPIMVSEEVLENINFDPEKMKKLQKISVLWPFSTDAFLF